MHESFDVLRSTLTGLYLAVAGATALYGLHRYWLVWLYLRHRKSAGAGSAPRRMGDWPAVTVQAPLYNEPAVAQRVIDALCRLDYPAQRLQIQILDDSTDHTPDLVSRRVAHWRQRGVNIEHRQRTARTGFKAGALANGLLHATGEFIAVFDADFVPRSSFLKRAVRHFSDAKVCCVQARWDHLNARESLLTAAQALFLDGHFLVEHTARHRAGRWINFNGTAGVWRRTAIDDAGGWQHDTLTEDIDLSYRAQLGGWRFVYLPGLGCPAELPADVSAFKTQQHRWAKGAIQTARKLLPRILLARVPLGVKVEAFFHLTCPMVYVYVTLMAMLFFPVLYLNASPSAPASATSLLLAATLVAMGSVSAATFYIASQRVRGRTAWWTLKQLPVLIAIGMGVALNNARGCLEALAGIPSEFVRTPKRGEAKRAAPGGKIVRRKRALLAAGLELAMGIYCLACFALAAQTPYRFFSLPFLMLFAAGYLYVGAASLHGLLHNSSKTERLSECAALD